MSLDTAVINDVTLKVAWEANLAPGPIGEYLEVVDVDPASRACYPPVDLDNATILAQDGLNPSEGSPGFHQQMVYGVAMTTIRNFEDALGRRVLWAPRRYRDDRGRWMEEFVPRLRIYPHALREANAYYSPAKKALLFGYFAASTERPGESLPGGIVFTCLSHDIIAHETTHALLDGMHRRYIEPSNVDVLAFHEAFSDIVALFQHFSYPSVLLHQIARTSGQLEQQNLLAQLAQEFGQALGRRGALRDALGTVDPKTGEWSPVEPDPVEILRTTEPHARGAILVAAVFDAFLTIYKARIQDLLRIATGGTGVLPAGELHPDLVNRLAEEASKTARHVMKMCIRALDYCPPVDITLGEYLRALVTADVDLVPDDRWNYRIALIEAFRQRGIYPSNVKSLSEESLLWQEPDERDQKRFATALRTHVRVLCPEWSFETPRQAMWDGAREIQRKFNEWFTDPPLPDAVKAVGLTLDEGAPRSIYRQRRKQLPAIEVHSVRPAYRMGARGNPMTDLILIMTQRRWGYLDADVQRKVDKGALKPPSPDFILRGGATLIIDLVSGKVRYAIGKGITSAERLGRQRAFLAGEVNPSLRTTYFGFPHKNYFDLEGGSVEPFAMLHRTSDPVHGP
jgi:hypothetical protein